MQAFGQNGRPRPASIDANIIESLPRYARGEDMYYLEMDFPGLRIYLTFNGMAATVPAQKFFGRLDKRHYDMVMSAIRDRATVLGHTPVLPSEWTPVTPSVAASAQVDYSEDDYSERIWQDLQKVMPGFAAAEDISKLKAIFPGISNFLTDGGTLSGNQGALLFYRGLKEQQRKELSAVLEARQKARGGRDVQQQYEEIDGGLDRYGSAENMTDLKSSFPSINRYLTDAGELASGAGAKTFWENLKEPQRTRMSGVMHSRQAHKLTAKRLVEITNVFLKTSNLESLAIQARINIGVLRKILTEGGQLTEVGQQIVQKQKRTVQTAIIKNLELKQQKVAERAERERTAPPQAPQFLAQPATPAASIGSIASHFTERDWAGHLNPPAGTGDNPVRDPYTAHEAGPSRHAGQAGVPPGIVDVDDYPSPQSRRVGIDERLKEDPWMRDDDILNYTQRFVAGQLPKHPNSQLIHFGDSLVVTDLISGPPDKRERALRRLTHPATPPIMFLPIHNVDHWSLLVVNRHSREAFHYDSKVAPHEAHRKTDTRQYGVALRVAQALGVKPPQGVPITPQHDDQSCGDHVMRGIEELAHRVVSGKAFTPNGMNLDTLEVDRDAIVDVLRDYD